jgi:transposase
MRYELSDYEWTAIKPMLPNKPRGVRPVNDRRVLNGIFWVLRSGAPWCDYDSQWGTRMKGTGPMAWMIGRRFEIACDKLGLNKRRSKLTTDHFARPRRSGQQLSLF